MSEEMFSKAQVDKICDDVLGMVEQIIIHAPDKEAMLAAVAEVKTAVKEC